MMMMASRWKSIKIKCKVYFQNDFLIKIFSMFLMFHFHLSEW